MLTERETAPNYESVMSITDSASRTAISTLVEDVPPQEAADFMKGVKVIDGIIQKEKPDIVFIPLRGAGPIRWTLEELYSSQPDPGYLPEFVDLPIGTNKDLSKKSEGGITKPQKTSIIRKKLLNLYENGMYVPGETSIMLLDEVQNGGTISAATFEIRQAMKYQHQDESEIVVVAVQDSRGGLIGNNKARKYKQIVSNTKSGIKAYVVPTQLFTVDQNVFLDAVLSGAASLGNPDEVSSEDFRLIQNSQAREVFKSLAKISIDPEKSTQETETFQARRTNGTITPEQINYETLETSLFDMLLVDKLTDSREVANDTTVSGILSWISEYARLVGHSKKLDD